jgi:hypothetical protein
MLKLGNARSDYVRPIGDRALPGSVVYDLLALALDCDTSDWPDYMDEYQPDYFVVEHRTHSGRAHTGWAPVWGETKLRNWSYQRLLKTDKAWEKMKQVLRDEVRDVVEEIAAAHPLYGRETIHVHHGNPFEHLVTDWLEIEKLDYRALEYEAVAPPDALEQLVDRDLAARWSVYHVTEGDLVALTVAEHKAEHAINPPRSKRHV